MCHHLPLPGEILNEAPPTASDQKMPFSPPWEFEIITHLSQNTVLNLKNQKFYTYADMRTNF